MKLLKIFGGLVAAIALVFVIGGAVLPKDFHVEREIVVDAPPEVAFAEINDLRGWEAWSPWKERDPTMVLTYGDQTEGVGGNYSWTGKDGGGSMKIVKSEAPHRLETEIDFGEMGVSNGAWAFAPDGDGTKISWSMKGALPGLMGGWLGTQMDKWVGADFEEGLANLKPVVEARAEEVEKAKTAGQRALEDAAEAAEEAGAAVGAALEEAAKTLGAAAEAMEEAAKAADAASE